MKIPMRHALAVVVLGTSATAQLPFVSPTQAATVEGASENVLPFQNNTPRRYQQIHGDLPGAVLISRLAFRMDRTATPTPFPGTRAIDARVLMGNGPASHVAASRAMAANFTGTPSTVMARRILNWGPYGSTSGGAGPEPFTSTMVVPLDAPFAWSPAPTPTLTWEAVIFDNQATGAHPFMDADASSQTFAPPSTTGPGCTCTGRTRAYSLAVTSADVQGWFTLAVGADDGPANAPVYLAIGTSNLNTPVPGLCGNLLTDLLVVTPLGTSNARGSINDAQSLIGFHVFNSFPGATFFLQAHAVDTGFAGLPICNTDGQAITVPARNTAKVLRVTRMLDSSGTTTATTADYYATTSLGYGLVTQFQ